MTRLLCRLGLHRWRAFRINRIAVTPGYPRIEFGWFERWRGCGRCGICQRITKGSR